MLATFVAWSHRTIVTSLAVTVLALAAATGFYLSCITTSASERWAGIDTPPLENGIPILVYDRFGPTATDSMTVTLTVFESQLRYIVEHGYHVVSLRDAMEYFIGKDERLTSHQRPTRGDHGCGRP
jgi:hypothetical protein